MSCPAISGTSATSAIDRFFRISDRGVHRRSVHPLLWFIAALFVLCFAIDPITDWLT